MSGVPPADGYNESFGFHNVEGPVWLGERLLVSHISGAPSPPKSRILALDGGQVSVAFAVAGTNGLALDIDGALLGARHSDGSITRFDLAGGKTEIVVAQYGGKRFNSPNDLAVRSDGTIYFSDPDYQAPTPRPQAKTAVYRVTPAGVVTVFDDTLSNPNGVTLSLDEQSLFVAALSPIRKYPLNADGSAGTPVDFANFTSDGMVLDCAGNLYATGSDSVVVFDAAGAERLRLSVPKATNVAFGGPERRTLFITNLGNNAGLSKVEMNLPGLPY